MASSAGELRRRVLDLFTASVESDAQLTALWEAVHGGSQNVSYADAYRFAERAGEKLAAAFRAVQGDLPEHIDADFAVTLLYGTLHGDYTLVADVAAAVQDALNKQVPLGLKAVTAPLDIENIYSLAGKLAGYEKAADGLYLLDAPVVNFSQGVVDKTVEANVEFQGKAGLRPRVVRTMHGKGCPYCSSLAGAYDYPDVPKDVYRRHNNCRCTVSYDPGAGKRVQDVWSKRWTTAEERDKIEARKQVGLQKESTYQFENRELLIQHFQKHQAEYGAVSVQEYLQQASRLAEEKLSDDVVQLKRSDNSISKYRFSTNDFLVLNEDGTIRTFFKPDAGEEYWNYEIERNQ